MSVGIDNDCPDCEKLKTMLIDAETANAELGRQVAGLHGLLTRSGKTEVALRNELSRQREEEPEAVQVREVCDHWKLKLDHAKAKTPMTGERAKKVRARLKERFTVADLKKAIDGCALVPFVGPHGRKPTGNPRDRHDDLALICRDEETVERFMRYADEHGTAPRSVMVPVGPVGVEAILPKLEGVKEERPGQWNARCPAHDDRHASLSVAQGDKGAVVHCHAGCETDAIVRAAGLDIASLFDIEAVPVVVKSAKQVEALPDVLALQRWQRALHDNDRLLGRLAELRGWHGPALEQLAIGFDGERLVLPIRDQAGDLVNVLRYLPRRKNDAPKMLSTRGRRRDLFPAPETIEGRELWLVEGEPDAISGRELGLPVVAVPGVNGWRPEWGKRLVDRRVVVCFDCDEPGRAAAQRVLNDLRAVCDVALLDLEPERTDGYDLSDALLEKVDGAFLRLMAGAIVEEFAA